MRTVHVGHRPRSRHWLLAALGFVLLPFPAAADFVTFESGQVRPLALSPDGLQLFAVNTPDNRLEIFDVNGGAPTHVGAVPVGMEPVAVAVRPNGDEVWVVNHLSDSVSIVDLTVSPPRVVRTLLVGDEPRDIVFAGSGGDRAFITTAHRGQNTSLQPTIDTVLRTEGIGRADVWVFDATNLGATLGGTPLTIVNLFGDTPRALAASPDGSTVYAAVFHSGNQTTTLAETAVCNGGSAEPPCALDGLTMPNGLPGGQVPGGLPAPNENFQGTDGPEVGLIVRYDEGSGQWRDQLARNWTNAVRFSLPDKDVFAIDANANPPVETTFFAHVGTVLFNMVVNPADDTKVYVANTEARNEVRFEGPGTFFGITTVRGHLHEARITVLDGANVVPRHLNKHITALPMGYQTTPMPAGIADDSLATPMGMAITSDGATLYVAAFGSSKVGIFDTALLESNGFVPDENDHIAVTGGGPSGLVLDETNDRLYVFTRFNNSLSVIDTVLNDELTSISLHNPEPASVVNGRRFLYDARFTSSNGEASCSSCHIFGDFDSLAWDLGNPDDVVATNPNPGVPDPFFPPIPFFSQPFHPMKGPMTTQTLRGMANHGPMHWRGDRTGAYAEPSVEPNDGAFDEAAAFTAFQVAFDGLLGRDTGPLPGPDMQAFTNFILQVTLPPNPIRDLDNDLTLDQQNGMNVFTGPDSDLVAPCSGCHSLNASAGFFGANGRSTFEQETQEFKVAHLRNMYQKIGMFGMPEVDGISFLAGENAHTGDQIRGFGFLHDGAVDTLFRFHRGDVFFLSDVQRRQLESLMFAFDSTLAPIVGQQITLTSTNGGTVDGRIDLLLQSAEDAFILLGVPSPHECDLIVKGVVEGEERGFQYNPNTDRFLPDRATELSLTDAQLRALVDTAGESLTYTCAPPGSGHRMGIDRDDDSYLDMDEIDAGSDPADPDSIPGGGPTPTPTLTPNPSGPLCNPTPEPVCGTAAKSLLVIKKAAGQEKLSWKWLKGIPQVDLNDFGNPVSSTVYSLCLHSAGLVTEIQVGPGASAWSANNTGFKYLDPLSSQNGVKKILLKAGLPGKGKILFKGEGSSLPLPSFYQLPFRVQLLNSNGECWESNYMTVIKNTSALFKAKF